MMKTVKLGRLITLIIPNWNGIKLLERNLPGVISVLPEGSEVIVVDDGSSDKSVDYLHGKPLRKLLNESQVKIKIIKNFRNRGFIYSCNRAAKEASGEYLVLLNNDVVPYRGFLERATSHFKDPDVFAISFNEGQFGWAKIWWRGGFIHHGVGGSGKRPHISAWASGGSAVFRKTMWEKLGGFDELFHPFYWEDFDLGYRAWKNGWKIIWEPEAKVSHKHESTTAKIDRSYLSLVKERNQLLFIWKNIKPTSWRVDNVFGIILRILVGPNYLKVLASAIRQYLRKGKPTSRQGKLTDREIISKFK